MIAGADTVVDTLLASTTVIADGSTAIGATADELAGSLFGASLFPWLAMLYWLKHPTVAAPPGVSFGLTFLLAFVFGSIPAAIGAGALYGVSLADADWLHGAAESLLAITNCVVVLGFRDALGRRLLGILQFLETLRGRRLGRLFFGRAARLELGLGRFSGVLFLDAQGREPLRRRQCSGLDARLPFFSALFLDLGRAGAPPGLGLGADLSGSRLSQLRRALSSNTPRLGRRERLAPLVVLGLHQVVPRLDPPPRDL